MAGGEPRAKGVEVDPAGEGENCSVDGVGVGVGGWGGVAFPEGLGVFAFGVDEGGE